MLHVDVLLKFIMKKCILDIKLKHGSMADYNDGKEETSKDILAVGKKIFV